MGKFTQLSFFENETNEPEMELDASIRRVEHGGEMYYSLVDVMAHFSDTTNAARKYWNDTKKRLVADGFDVSGKIGQLKLPASDGKKYKTDCADAETVLRIVQSIPSPKAEPVRQWFAKLAKERLEETANPALGIERAVDRATKTYLRQGKDEKWIVERFDGVVDQKAFKAALTSAVSEFLTPSHYATAQNDVYLGLWQRTAAELRGQMKLKKSQSLRDHQPREALAYQRIAESAIARMLEGKNNLAFDEADQIIRKIAGMVGEQARQLSEMLGVDLATGQNLLSAVNHYYEQGDES